MKIDKVTITGADESTSIEWMRDVSAEYPFVEWGILVSASQMASSRFPSLEWMGRLAKVQDGLQTSVHVCGKWVREICDGNWSGFLTEIGTLAGGAQRIQLNFHAIAHTLGDAFLHAAHQAARRTGWQLIFQVDGVNDYLASRAHDDGINAVPLYDQSGGAGEVPGTWPVQMAGIYSGYAGGLGPDNVVAEIQRIEQVACKDSKIWIDMETRVRTDDDSRLDRNAVESVLRQCAGLECLEK